MLSAEKIRLEGISSDTPARNVETIIQSDDMLPFDDILCTDLRSIGRKWYELPREDITTLPQWSDFKLSEFAEFADKLCVLKVKDGRVDDIEFSLYGGHPTDFLGHGKPLVMQKLRRDPLRNANYLDIRDRAFRALKQEAPQYARKTLSWNNNNFIEYETMMLPFAESGGIQRLLQPISAWARIKALIDTRRLTPYRKTMTSAFEDHWKELKAKTIKL